jgi:hypothetical protein
MKKSKIPSIQIRKTLSTKIITPKEVNNVLGKRDAPFARKRENDFTLKNLKENRSLLPNFFETILKPLLAEPNSKLTEGFK